MAGGSGVPMLLVTANVGSIFEEPSVMLKIWTEEFLSTVLRLEPKFIALHCQEVGGKNYEQSMRHVEDFVRLLMSSEELRLFDKIRVFLDEDYSSAEHFTALGNFYFVHESLKDVLLWDFKECTFVPVTGKEVYSGNIEAVSTKEKAKFPQDFFPECKWSRKGFMRTRWSLSETVFDLINIHLFHDASNFIAMEMFPSVYSKTRRRALEHTLDRFHNDRYPNVPYFLFGDFNFRTDTAGVIKKLTEDTQEKKLSNKGSISKLQFRNKEDDLILTLGKKEFCHHEHQNVFIQNSGEWLREYDRELEDFVGRLFEFPIKFPPSYPFEEDINEATTYMHTRVPAWCDRVLLSPTAKTLVQDLSSSSAVDYGIIGPTTCMGDHKPVYLRAVLASDAGMINCCSLPRAPEFCFRVPNSYSDLLSMLPDSNSSVSARGFDADRSSNLLHAVPIKHDPYTPDSMDSPSPNAIIIAGYTPDVDIDQLNGDTLVSEPVHQSQTLRRLDRAVSPALLKSKLELIVKSTTRKMSKERSHRDCLKRSPSDSQLQSWVDTEFGRRHIRKYRSNSDISWQRFHTLTQTWAQGKIHQGYHSLTNVDNRSFSSSPPERGNHFLTDRVIPRIAIINASNFESNESSVYLHDEKFTCCTDIRPTTCSDSRARTFNENLTRDKLPTDACDNIGDESDRLSGGIDERIDFKTSQNLEYTNHVQEKGRVGADSDSTVLREESASLELRNCDSMREKLKENVDCDTEKIVVDISDKMYITDKIAEQSGMNRKCSSSSMICLENRQTSRTFDEMKGDHNEIRMSSNKEAPETCDVQVGKSVPKSQNAKKQECDYNIINICTNVQPHGVTGNDMEILRCESKQEILTSKQTTRSNSVQSQDIGDNVGNVKLRLKAYKVTQRYKNNIVGKRGKCQKCCCAIS